MAIQQDSKPALPPRPTVINETGFSGCAKTPPSWLTALVHHNEGNKKHVHEFFLSECFANEPETVLICKKCHKRFILSTSISTQTDETTSQINFDRGMCAVNLENKLHHLHTTISTKTNVASQCCYCNFTVNVEIHEPYIEIQIFDDLQKTRHIPTYSNITRKTNGFENGPSINLFDTLDLLSKIITKLINNADNADGGIRLNVNSKVFTSKVGYDNASKAFFDKLGYELVDDQYMEPPPLTDEYTVKLKHVKEQIEMKTIEIHEKASGQFSTSYKEPYEKLETILGTKYEQRQHRTLSSFDPTNAIRSPSPSCTTLGCVSDMDDKTLEWAYLKAIEESPEKIPEYLQAIYEASKERKSEQLEQLVAVQKSLGNFSQDDVSEAYSVMKANPNVSDEQLIDAYKYYTGGASAKKYCDSLLIIGKFRRSETINKFLIEEGSNEVDMTDYFSDMPVGLDNIGNTCYLNSLLQYYFTIRNLREAVLSADTSSINGLDNNWESLTSGGRKVSKSEVERAKKFVSLLRDLFIDLMQTSYQSIAPNTDLAYLALVNAKNDDEYKETTKSPMDTSTNSDMVMDDSSPGPSAPATASAMNLSDSSSSPPEIEEVLMSGVSPNCTDQDPLYRSTNGQYQTESDASILHSLKGKEKEDNFSTAKTYGPHLPDDSLTTTKEDKIKTASSMLFGKQQDVTECMDNVMFQLQAALKVTMPDQNGEQQNIVESLFYGQTRQVLQYKDQHTGGLVQNIKEEQFNHLISLIFLFPFVVSEGRDLYDGLDVCFDTSTVEFDGTQAQRDVTLTRLPPILQIQVQRVQFDRSTSNVYKSNAYLRLEPTIYLDRYLDKHHEHLRERRIRAHEMKQEIELLQTELKDLTQDKTTFLPTVDLLKFTSEFVQSIKDDDSDFIIDENFDWRLPEIEQERQRVNKRIDGNFIHNVHFLGHSDANFYTDIQHRIFLLRTELKELYKDMTECVYRLYAVFIHSGQATFGHYWIYIYDFEKNRWLKYNDSYVTKVDDYEVFADTTGKSANPYCMVYVRAQGNVCIY
ncbi:20530_t:CDS:10 [Dentiscutata erythropus]|uniref:ubiquitinyl hydrolase 1 n=1 Tax=Dentiscutata erythropus TaxID=1348616 RepID=A0A9N9C5D4_9GLOM|nr:20530_t:CDS:10 [Dentiscutata erythropus]